MDELKADRLPRLVESFSYAVKKEPNKTGTLGRDEKPVMGGGAKALRVILLARCSSSHGEKGDLEAEGWVRGLSGRMISSEICWLSFGFPSPLSSSCNWC